MEVVTWLLSKTFARNNGVSFFAVSRKPQTGFEEIFIYDITELTAGLYGFGHLLARGVIKLESPFDGWRLEKRMVVRNRFSCDSEGVVV